MKIHKQTMYWMIILCTFSFVISLVLYRWLGSEYWVNIFIGIFASGILTMFLSIINYRISRKISLEKFYLQANKIRKSINKYDNDGNLQRTMNIIIEMSECDYEDLGIAYSDIEFIFSNTKTKQYIYKSIYKPLINIKSLIDDKARHFIYYNNSSHGNLEAMKILVGEIDKEIMQRKKDEYQSLDGTITKTEYSFNKINRDVKDELNSRYYDIMYNENSDT